MKNQLRAFAVALVLAAALVGLALFVGGLLVALAVLVPVSIVIAVLCGKARVSLREDDGHRPL